MKHVDNVSVTRVIIVKNVIKKIKIEFLNIIIIVAYVCQDILKFKILVYAKNVIILAKPAFIMKIIALVVTQHRMV